MALVSEPTDLAAALIEADEPTRARMLRETEAGRLDAVITELGHRRESAAAAVLDAIDRIVDDRALRKAARRELHRLRSAGVQVPVMTVAAPVGAERRPEPTVEVSEAWATDVDPNGARAMWILGERPLGGAWLGALLLNDHEGLRDLSLVDTTRKRFQRELDEQRREDATWVSLPGDYALRLVREAVDLTRARGGGLPTRYRAFRETFGEADGPPERGLVYETVSPVEANFNPEWLEESGRLVREPEVSGWHVAVPEALRARALEVARSSGSALVVPTHPPELQALQLLSDAAAEALTPEVRRSLRRRLEETGYVFVETDRLGAARLAVAAARAIDDPSVPLERQPLVRALLESGLARLVQSELVGSRRASEVLIELMERAAERQRESPGAVATRPSGLILPR